MIKFIVTKIQCIKMQLISHAKEKQNAQDLFNKEYKGLIDVIADYIDIQTLQSLENLSDNQLVNFLIFFSEIQNNIMNKLFELNKVNKFLQKNDQVFNQLFPMYKLKITDNLKKIKNIISQYQKKNINKLNDAKILLFEDFALLVHIYALLVIGIIRDITLDETVITELKKYKSELLILFVQEMFIISDSELIMNPNTNIADDNRIINLMAYINKLLEKTFSLVEPYIIE